MTAVDNITTSSGAMKKYLSTLANSIGTFLAEPKYRKWHAAIITFALISHGMAHYANYFPEVRAHLSSIPYFEMHVLHEAEFLLIIFYATLIFKLKGGLLAVGMTGIASIPFVFSSQLLPSTATDPAFGDFADSYASTISSNGTAATRGTEVILILSLGMLMVALAELERRRKDATERADLAIAEIDLKNNYISIASHELRNPLTTLSGFSELLMNRTVPEETKSQWIKQINSESGRLARILDEMLNTARVESGNLVNNPSEVDLQEVIEEAVKIAAEPDARRRVTLNLDANLPKAYADPSKLTQVFSNLIGNAVKYSPAGGNVEITAKFRQDKNGIVVSVKDHGVGMTVEDMSNLFKKFYRSKDKSIANIPGNGLGLYIVKSFVSLMGGEIWVESELGKGSTFHVSVPTSKPAPSNSAAGRQKAKGALN